MSLFYYSIWNFTFLVIFSILVQPSVSDAKLGRCPEPTMDKRLCGDQTDQCSSDSNCSGDSKCCFTGCSQVCILPVYTLCEHMREFAQNQSETLTPDSYRMPVPKCKASGTFEEIQCENEDATGNCYCVDEFTGLEKPGTRVEGLENVNCTRKNEKCSSHQCRMLCEDGFEIDWNGCSICRCRDPCRGVKCGNGNECTLEALNCGREFCPTVPSCKRGRSLSSNPCTIGNPLIISETNQPFQCTQKPNNCPPAFVCTVQPGIGDQQNQKGVCCASNSFFEKPGNCPTVSGAEVGQECETYQSSCSHDLECPTMEKCCMSTSCGKQCTKPMNSTACLQQKKIAELLSVKELDGKGYVPQCNEVGEFVPKQCSTNGKICWCVDERGVNLPQSLGPAQSVNCDNTNNRKRDLVEPKGTQLCDNVICSNSCELGYKVDEQGCPSCDCNVNPCDGHNCPGEASICKVIPDSNCQSGRINTGCKMFPACLTSNKTSICPTNYSPFTHDNQIILCTGSHNCPLSHAQCTLVPGQEFGHCCGSVEKESTTNGPSQQLELTKSGMCPANLPASLCYNAGDHVKCESDKDCNGDLKCCGVNECGGGLRFCVEPIVEPETKLPTMCQYLRTISQNLLNLGATNQAVFKLAIPQPQCKENGDFQEFQCNGGECYCVDEFGAEILDGETRKMQNLTNDICTQLREIPGCLGINCKLGCDYGYAYDAQRNCRICECSNPCKQNPNRLLCGAEEVCEMVDLDCLDSVCPALPICIPREIVAAHSQSGIGNLEPPAEIPSNKGLTERTIISVNELCPSGAPFIEPESNDTLSCSPRARMLQCPDDYFCHSLDENYDLGFCCPIHDNTDSSNELQAQTEVQPQTTSLNTNTNEVLVPTMHCIPEVNMCWCLNSHGKRVPGTLTRGPAKPNCNFRQSRSKSLNKDLEPKENQSICPTGVNVHVCNSSICEGKVCMSNPQALCSIDPCGSCQIQFIDPNTNAIVDCESGLSPCERELQRVVNSDLWTNQKLVQQQAQSESSNIYGDSKFGFEAQMELNFGDDEPLTIVTRTGRKNNNNNGRKGVMRSLDSITDILEAAAAEEVNFHDFTELFDLIPSGSSAYWETSLPSSSRRMKRTPHHFHHHHPHSHHARKLSFSHPTLPSILLPFLMDSQLYSAPATAPQARSHQVLQSPTKCPEISPASIFLRLTQPCPDQCNYDQDCYAPGQKCCLMDCGYKCVEFKIKSSQTQPRRLPPPPPQKPGKCPNPSILNISCSMRASVYPVPSCNSDFECRDAEKCCFDGCNHSCLPTFQADENMESLMMNLRMPSCQLTGDYQIVQNVGDLSWCVNPKTGEAFPDTFTRGKVICSADGEIVERKPVGNVCPGKPYQKPMICPNVCLNATCPGYPNAMCMADPCNNCQVSFYSSSGEKVQCGNKCHQQPDPGMCRASIQRFYYNPMSQNCENFIYGGCQGNGNNFVSHEECVEECKTSSVDICTLEPEAGICYASIERWYFDSKTETCKEFTYGGCGGNGNNFPSKERCEARCPNIVICPNIVNDDLVYCNREKACGNYKNCGDGKSCIVEPCSCTAKLVDENGNEVNECKSESQDAAVGESSDSAEVLQIESRDGSIEFVQDDEGTTMPSSEMPFLSLKYNSESQLKSRCKSMTGSDDYQPKCDPITGKFLPTQCHSYEDSSEIGICFCVDTAGNFIQGSKAFTKDEQQCKEIPIEKINLRLVFNLRKKMNVNFTQIGQEIHQFLSKFNAQIQENRIKVEEILSENTLEVAFTLTGDNCVDLSYTIEEMIRKYAFGLENSNTKEFIPADLSKSEFEHIPVKMFEQRTSQIPPYYEPSSSSGDDIVKSQVIGTSSGLFEQNWNIIAILLTLSAAITAVFILIGLFLGMQKKKTMGSYPKKPFESLAFGSLYDKKISASINPTAPTSNNFSLTNPTFKVTKEVKEIYGETDEKVPPV